MKRSEGLKGQTSWWHWVGATALVLLLCGWLWKSVFLASDEVRISDVPRGAKATDEVNTEAIAFSEMLKKHGKK